MGLQSELMHSALNVKYSIAGLSFDEILGFYSAFIRIAARKVDWGCVVRWTPTKFFEFVREMARISINNNIECGRTENDVCNYGKIAGKAMSTRL